MHIFAVHAHQLNICVAGAGFHVYSVHQYQTQLALKLLKGFLERFARSFFVS